MQIWKGEEGERGLHTKGSLANLTMLPKAGSELEAHLPCLNHVTK